MTPSVDGRVHWFAEHGLYDGLFLMRDEESETYWDHMTGEAVYGPLTGARLEVSNLMQTTVAQVLDLDRDALVTISDRAIRTDEQMTTGSLIRRVGGRLNRMFRATVNEEDARRPTMDIGMGIWDGELARYYPYDEVVESGNAVFDNFGGRQVVIYLGPLGVCPRRGVHGRGRLQLGRQDAPIFGRIVHRKRHLPRCIGRTRPDRASSSGLYALVRLLADVPTDGDLRRPLSLGTRTRLTWAPRFERGR